ncbi:MAG: DUF1080 domain-containing protein [Planctomycetes bacterium]|nr:DUF1080 domain-containing protein [Planctomycetota bacterium]
MSRSFQLSFRQVTAIVALATCVLVANATDAARSRRSARRTNRSNATNCCRSGQPAPPLFDGRTLDNWTTIAGQPVTTGWEVVDGVIHLNKEQGRAGHIISKHEYGDFELTFDWKIAEGGNSGLKYRVRKYGNKTLGCEYQIYDDEKASNLPPRGSTGSLYALYEPNESKQLNPAGEFNSTRIVVCGNWIEHWLNGKRILTAIVGSPEWDERVAASKFSNEIEFGENRYGKIMLTDHGSEVWYRNIQLRPLN